MTYEYSTGTPSTSEGTSTAQTARDEASGVAQSAAESGKYLAGEAGAQAKNVAAEAGRQAKDLLGQGRTQLASTATEQQQRLAGGLRTFSSDLSQMADGAESSLASGIARTVADQTGSIASWFENREPADLLNEVKDFARRKPGTFLLIAAGAGLIAGRLTRGVRDASSDTSTGGTSYGDGTGAHRAPGAASTGSYGLADTSQAQTYGTTGSTSTYGTTGTIGTYGTPAYGTGAYGDADTAGGSSYGSGTTGAGYGERTYQTGGVGGGETPVASTSAATPAWTGDDTGSTSTGDPLAGVESEERWTEENR
ncbi:hypothetical protein ICW40_05305 [Actinotalea ferrariae]|uniref:hypothetical protein n=1 Tax=Actinotalea ferrariae TaxID=1386098 RepID=UPI001C8B636F|nr:hypothetical protein [Actinotalea ferrariae]MBX9244223.1 hypothetical protein [Actinotalea ferrariae]